MSRNEDEGEGEKGKEDGEERGGYVKRKRIKKRMPKTFC